MTFHHIERLAICNHERIDVDPSPLDYLLLRRYPSIAPIIRSLHGRANITHLDFSGTQLSFKTMSILISTIPHIKNLQDLNLSRTGTIAPYHVKFLQKSLATLMHFSALRIASIGLTKIGAIYIFSLIQRSHTLTVLDISNNPIGPNTLQLLKVMTQDIHSQTPLPHIQLATLNVSGTNSNDAQISHIFALLTTLKTLTEIDISNNNLSSNGLKSLTTAIRNREQLQLNANFRPLTRVRVFEDLHFFS